MKTGELLHAVGNGEQEKNTSATFRSLVTSSVCAQCACMGVRCAGICDSVDHTFITIYAHVAGCWSLSSAPLYPSFPHNRWHTSVYYKPIMCSGKLTCGQLISASPSRVVRFGTRNRIRQIFHEREKKCFSCFSRFLHTYADADEDDYCT